MAGEARGATRGAPSDRSRCAPRNAREATARHACAPEEYCSAGQWAHLYHQLLDFCSGRQLRRLRAPPQQYAPRGVLGARRGGSRCPNPAPLPLLPPARLWASRMAASAADWLAWIRWMFRPSSVFGRTSQCPPAFVKGQVRQALSLALQAVLEAGDPEAYPLAALRAWKLWLLLPRMLLHRKAGERWLPKQEWRARLAAFQDGRWTHLLLDVRRSLPPEAGLDLPHPQAARGPAAGDPACGSDRARRLAHLSELSSARQALTAAPLAPGNEATLAELRDPARRPAAPYSALPSEVLSFQRSKKGAAPGPSALTAESARLMLDSD